MLNMIAIVSMQVIGFAIGKELMDRWLVSRQRRHAAKHPPEKITVVKFTEIE